MKVTYSLKTLNKSVNVWFMGHLQYEPAYFVQKFLASRYSDCQPSSETRATTLDTLLIVEHSPGKQILS